MSSLWLLALLAPLAAIAAILAVPPLRRALVSNRVLAIFRKVMPPMSDTEATAINAGTVWWDGDLFSGKPDWSKLLAFPKPVLSAEEQAFLEGETEELCRIAPDWDTYALGDLPPHAWQYIKDKGFLGMIIPKTYGGKGFSAYAHSQVVTKLSTRCSAAAVSVMVPNSLGPADLLLHYGTEEQKRYYLPRLAKGLEIPCFALTNPHAGSDAAAIPDRGVVCKGIWEGREVLGMRVTWEKRYITLGPVATLLGLAFRLHDPDRLLGGEEDVGITCALIPTSTPGVHIGRRHMPLNAVFQNGPNWGKDVFMPLDWIIGGPKMAGQGWRMLMECLAAGRSISLPSSNVGMSKLAVARDRRVRARAHPVPHADREVRGHRGGADPDGRQPVHDGRGAGDDRGRDRPRREAVGHLRHRQVPHHRAQPSGRQRRDGHPGRQGHLPRAQQLHGPRLPADPGRRSRSRARTS